MPTINVFYNKGVTTFGGHFYSGVDVVLCDGVQDESRRGFLKERFFRESGPIDVDEVGSFLERLEGALVGQGVALERNNVYVGEGKLWTTWADVFLYQFEAALENIN